MSVTDPDLQGIRMSVTGAGKAIYSDKWGGVRKCSGSLHKLAIADGSDKVTFFRSMEITTFE